MCYLFIIIIIIFFFCLFVVVGGGFFFFFFFFFFVFLMQSYMTSFTETNECLAYNPKTICLPEHHARHNWLVTFPAASVRLPDLSVSSHDTARNSLHRGR